METLQTHTHMEDGDPQLARGLCRPREGQFQVLGPHAHWVTGSRGCPQAAPHDAAGEAGQISPPPGLLPSPLPRALPKHTRPLLSARTLLAGTSAKLVQNPFRVGTLIRICLDGLGSSLLQRDQIHDQPNRQSSPLPSRATRLGPLLARHKKQHCATCYLFP